MPQTGLLCLQALVIGTALFQIRLCHRFHPRHVAATQRMPVLRGLHAAAVRLLQRLCRSQRQAMAFGIARQCLQPGGQCLLHGGLLCFLAAQLWQQLLQGMPPDAGRAQCGQIAVHALPHEPHWLQCIVQRMQLLFQLGAL